jgi:Protein of unknown function (DUF5674)
MIDMKQIDDTISVESLRAMSERMYGSLVKADVDLERCLLVVDMDMHADGEALLLDSGSKQEDVWGINLHPDKYGTNEFVEFDSMINTGLTQNLVFFRRAFQEFRSDFL